MNLFVDVPRTPEASAHLSRSQIAQKLGARKCDFPRTSGVLIPRALAGVWRAQPTDAANPKNIGRQLAVAVSRRLRALPAELLALEVPHPSTVLRSLPIEDRTRGVLDRLLPILAKETTWTVGRYLRIPKFGARCLVDLLAACEEAEPGSLRFPTRPAIRAGGEKPRTLMPLGSVALPRLDDISRLLHRLLPISEEDVARVLVDEGLAAAPVTLAHLAGAYRAAGQPAPFRVVTCGDMAIAVAVDTHGVSATVAATAVRLVSHWGLSTVDSVVERVGVLRSSSASRAMVLRLLVALPRLRWLDDRMEWFSLVGDRSRLRRAVIKIFAVADSVPIGELRLALDKGQARARHVPRPVLERYLSEIADCEVEPNGVRLRAREPGTSLDGDEAVVAGLLSTADGPLAIEALSDLAWARASVPEARLRRLLRSSPLFVRTRARQVRLVGRRERP